MTMSLTRRRFTAGLAALPLAPGAMAHAQAPGDFPNRPVTVIMPLQAGSASDIAVRLLLERITERAGHRFVVENVAAAAGMVGAARVAGAPPDGYTLAALNNSILTILPNVQRRPVGFDPFGSFVPISGIAKIPTFLGVHKDVPVKTLPDLLALAKAKPDAINYASGGAGSPQHLATEMFMAMTGAKLTQVPYRGATAAAADLAGGHVQMMFIAHSLAIPFLDNGSIRLIAFGGSERHPAFPAIPTIAEQGYPEFDYSSWIALFALKGTPEPIVAKLRAEAAGAVGVPALKERLEKAGLAHWPTPPDGVVQAMKDDDQRWKAVVRDANITI